MTCAPRGSFGVIVPRSKMWIRPPDTYANVEPSAVNVVIGRGERASRHTRPPTLPYLNVYLPVWNATRFPAKTTCSCVEPGSLIRRHECVAGLATTTPLQLPIAAATSKGGTADSIEPSIRTAVQNWFEASKALTRFASCPPLATIARGKRGRRRNGSRRRRPGRRPRWLHRSDSRRTARREDRLHREGA